jgi:hypothetical protein
MAEAVVAKGAQSGGQDVPQIARDKLDAGNGRCFPAIALGAIFPAEGDRVIAERHDPRIADGRAKRPDT